MAEKLNKPTWIRGHTSVSDLSFEEKKKLCGGRPLNSFETAVLNERIEADAKRIRELDNANGS